MVSVAVGCGDFSGWGAGGRGLFNLQEPGIPRSEMQIRWHFLLLILVSFQFSEVVDYVKKHEVTLYLIPCLSIWIVLYNSLLDLMKVCETSFFPRVLSVFNMAAALDL